MEGSKSRAKSFKKYESGNNCFLVGKQTKKMAGGK
jgi:hypothetical protein